MLIRTPAVAGVFYPKTNQELKSNIRDCFLHDYGPGKLPPSPDNQEIIGVICPHAGYEYSGPIAANSYYAISSQRPDLVIIIGPNHWGIGREVATMKEGIWKTPLGDVEVDTELTMEINRICKSIELDSFSHSKDHCLEVQLPMLQVIFSHKFKILPLILIDQRYQTTIEIGKAMAEISKIKKTMIICSSDLTHYEPNDFAHMQDRALIEAIMDLDVEKFYNILQERQISACGYGAIASTMMACKELGARKGTLKRYATSGDITGNKNSVVGYSSIVFT
jgi:MEMO1 family protein